MTPFFAAGKHRALPIEEGDLSALQAFFDTNPEYELTVTGEPPGPGRAREIFDAVPPEGWPFRAKWLMRLVDEEGAIVGVADVIEDLFSAGIWHIGFFVVATKLHGSGAAAELYRALENWTRERGARWLRLGVVVGNKRAERFWERCAYVDVARREGVEMGRRTNALRIMAKPLAGGGWDEYFDKVVRDRSPES